MTLSLNHVRCLGQFLEKKGRNWSSFTGINPSIPGPSIVDPWPISNYLNATQWTLSIQPLILARALYPQGGIWIVYARPATIRMWFIQPNAWATGQGQRSYGFDWWRLLPAPRHDKGRKKNISQFPTIIKLIRKINIPL